MDRLLQSLIAQSKNCGRDNCRRQRCKRCKGGVEYRARQNSQA